MADKQSLYDLLGLSDKASPEDIQQACAALRQALDAQPDSEEKHNRIAILQDARDVLLDRRRRAGYDRRRRDRRDGDHRQAAARELPRRTKPVLAALLIAAIAWPAWRYAAPPPVAAGKPAAAAVASPQTAAADHGPEAISADVAALLPPPTPAAHVPDIVPVAAAGKAPAPQAPPQQLFADSADSPTLDKFSASTYLIIGGTSLGTGVAVEGDKLLTNCHVIAPNVLKGPLYAVNPATGQKTLIVAAAFLITEDACVAHAPGLNGKPIALGNAAQLARGAPIYNIGFAQGRLIASGGKLLGVINRHGQTYLVSSNYCDHGVSGGPLVDAEGRLVGLTSGGPRDRSFCLSLTTETARRVLDQTLIAIDA
ncbi:MAG: trypsin-like peptidase domain-containing protein, partial [Sulfuritalea sp.]|nr:trypsin-like peptidase domain-containing protein [Sulfuritalea sp.]